MTFDDPRQPYIGARPFRAEDATRFFGRSAETELLRELWRGHPLTVLHGANGCGKTSLLHAGALVGRAGVPVGRLNGTFATPDAALPADHNPWTLALLTSWAPMERLSTLAGMGVTDFVTWYRRRQGGTMFAAIDQFEDLFQGGPHRALHRDRFLRQLVEALDQHPDLRLLIVIRSSRRDDLADDGEMLARSEWMRLGPLAGEAVYEAVTGPLEATHRRLTRKAAELLIDQLGGDRVEPVILQAVCARFWDELPKTVQLIGPEEVFLWANVPGRIASFVGAVLSRVGAEFGRGPDDLRSWARAAFADGVPVKQGINDTEDMSNAIVRALEEEYLLRSEPGHRVRLLDEAFRSALDRPAPGAATGGGSRHLQAAKAALASGDTVLAEQQAEAALRVADVGFAAEAHAILGDIAIEHASYDKAYGRAEHAAEAYARALAEYELALQRFADLNDRSAAARMLAAIGQVSLSQGDFPAAVAKLEEAATLLPRDSAIRTQLARALWATDSRSRAMTEIDEVLRDEGEELAALRARGEFNADRGRAEDALRDLGRVSSGAWPTAKAARTLALATLDRLDLREAEQEADAVVAEAPSNGPALFYVARAVETLSGDPAGLARMAVKATEPRLSARQREDALRLLEQGLGG